MSKVNGKTCKNQSPGASLFLGVDTGDEDSSAIKRCNCRPSVAPAVKRPWGL